MRPRTDYEAFLAEEGLEEQRQDEALRRHLEREKSKPIKVPHVGNEFLWWFFGTVVVLGFLAWRLFDWIFDQLCSGAC